MSKGRTLSEFLWNLFEKMLIGFTVGVVAAIIYHRQKDNDEKVGLGDIDYYG